MQWFLLAITFHSTKWAHVSIVMLKSDWLMKTTYTTGVTPVSKYVNGIFANWSQESIWGLNTHDHVTLCFGLHKKSLRAHGVSLILISKNKQSSIRCRVRISHIASFRLHAPIASAVLQRRSEQTDLSICRIGTCLKWFTLSNNASNNRSQKQFSCKCSPEKVSIRQNRSLASGLNRAYKCNT